MTSSIFLDPLPPPCHYQIHATSLPLVRNWLTPSPPVRADIICTSPLSPPLIKDGVSCTYRMYYERRQK